MIKEYALLIWRGIKHRKLRTFLTVLGIVIGIGAVIALLLVSNGLENSIKEEFAKIGTNRLFLSMKGSTTGQFQGGLTEDDIDAIRGLPYFKDVTIYLIKTWQVEYAKQVKTLMVTATSTENIESIWENTGIHIAEGRAFKTGDKYSAIIGQRITNDLFDKNVRINNKLIINGQPFKIVGIFEEFGNPQDDSNVFIPLDASREIIGNGNKEVTLADLILYDGVDAEEAAEAAKKILRNRRDLKPGDEDFEVSTPDQLLSQMNSVLGVVQAVLVAIAIIALIVGSIGIMNSMYTSVLERTKDIGIMRAVGGNYKNVLLLFLMEAFLIGIFGGIIGVILGVGVAKLFEWIAQVSGYSFFKIFVNYFYLLGGVLFSGLIGLMAGYLPAKRAASLKPADALRS